MQRLASYWSAALAIARVLCHLVARYRAVTAIVARQSPGAGVLALVSEVESLESPTSIRRPDPGYAIRCRVEEVYDGDTLTVSVTLPARIRLRDCWAAEIRTKDATEKTHGLAARDYLKEIAGGKTGVLLIRTGQASRLDDVLTMGRVLGEIWIDDGDPRDLSTRMCEAGHATRTKPLTH